MEACYECGQVIESIMFTVTNDGGYPEEFLCSTKCLNDWIVVFEATAALEPIGRRDG